MLLFHAIQYIYIYIYIISIYVLSLFIILEGELYYFLFEIFEDEENAYIFLFLLYFKNDYLIRLSVLCTF